MDAPTIRVRGAGVGCALRSLMWVLLLGMGVASAAQAQCSIRFTSPARGAVVTSPTLVVSGTASGFTQRYAAGSATATVNGHTFFSYSGVFTAQMNFGGGASAVATLQPGVNVLSVSGSASGCSASDSMVVHYEPLPGPEQSKTGTPTDPNCSNPINGAGGNKYQREVDVTATPGSPLPFERHYNSVVTTSRSLSRGWRHTYDRMLIAFEPELGSSAYAYRPDGRIAAFVRTQAGWEPQAHVLDRLIDVMVAGQRQWQLLNHQDNSTEVYNARGYLLAIVHANGRRLELAYDGWDRIVSVTDSLSGRRLSFTHTGPTSHRIATLTTPDGGVIRYGYSDAAGFPQLTTVTYLNGTLEFTGRLGVGIGAGASYEPSGSPSPHAKSCGSGYIARTSGNLQLGMALGPYSLGGALSAASGNAVVDKRGGGYRSVSDLQMGVDGHYGFGLRLGGSYGIDAGSYTNW